MTPFDRLGRFVARRAWWVVGAWAVVLSSPCRSRRGSASSLSAGGFILDDLESARAKSLLGRELGAPPSALVIVFSSPTLEAGTPAFEVAAAAAVADIPSAPHVVRVLSHLLSPRQVSADRHTAYDIVFLDLPPDDSPDALPILRARLHEAPGLAVELAGGPAFYGDVQSVSEADLRRSELISLPLAALALLFVFGSAVAAGVPLDRRRDGRGRRAREHLPGGPGDADEHLRAQPRHAARPRAGRRLLTAADEPLPRGAGAPTAGPDARAPMRSG